MGQQESTAMQLPSPAVAKLLQEKLLDDLLPLASAAHEEARKPLEAAAWAVSAAAAAAAAGG